MCVSHTTTNSTLGTIEKWIDQREGKGQGELNAQHANRVVRIDTAQLQIQIHFECVL